MKSPTIMVWWGGQPEVIRVRMRNALDPEHRRHHCGKPRRMLDGKTAPKPEGVDTSHRDPGTGY